MLPGSFPNSGTVLVCRHNTYPAARWRTYADESLPDHRSAAGRDNSGRHPGLMARPARSRQLEHRRPPGARRRARPAGAGRPALCCAVPYPVEEPRRSRGGEGRLVAGGAAAGVRRYRTGDGGVRRRRHVPAAGLPGVRVQGREVRRYVVAGADGCAHRRHRQPDPPGRARPPARRFRALHGPGPAVLPVGDHLSQVRDPRDGQGNCGRAGRRADAAHCCLAADRWRAGAVGCRPRDGGLP